jgi:hypothetical protein
MAVLTSALNALQRGMALSRLQTRTRAAAASTAVKRASGFPGELGNATAAAETSSRPLVKPQLTAAATTAAAQAAATAASGSAPAAAMATSSASVTVAASVTTVAATTTTTAAAAATTAAATTAATAATPAALAPKAAAADPNAPPTLESTFGPMPWLTSPMGQSPDGSLYAYNPTYFATAATAAKVAQMLGGQVVETKAICSTPGSPFQQLQNNQMVQMADGRMVNPGLVASFYTHGYPQSYIDRLVAGERNGTAA